MFATAAGQNTKPPRGSPDVQRALDVRQSVSDALAGVEWDGPLGLPQLPKIIATLEPIVPGVPPRVWHEFFMPYFSQLMSTVLDSVAWRIAGTEPQLRKKTCPALWSAGSPQEYCGGVLTGSEPRMTISGKSITSYRVRIVTGTAAGAVGQLEVPTRGVYSIAPRMGFSQRRGRYPLNHPAELVHLRVLCLIHGQRPDGTPNVIDTCVPSKYFEHNREIVKLRRREYPCPYNFSHECVDCPLSFSQCGGSVHRFEWTVAECPNCRVNRVFDPELSDRVCRACWYQGRR